MANVPAVQQIKNLITQDEVKNRFTAILKDKANQFMASIVNVVSNNESLQKCDPNSIMASALIAATFDMPIDQNLGFAAIVPYGTKAQFQMMYRGFVQLAIRSGQYKDIHVSEVYEDELKYYNPITGEIEFYVGVNANSYRNTGKVDKIIGFYANFELLNGFKKGLYMTCEATQLHAEKYSASYKYDLKKNTKNSMWTTDFIVMSKKTVLKLLLSKWGVLSLDMQRVIIDDQKVVNSSGETSYADNPASNAKDKELEEKLKMEEKKEPTAAELYEKIRKKLKDGDIDENDFWKAQHIEKPVNLSSNDYITLLDNWDLCMKDYFTGGN